MLRPEDGTCRECGKFSSHNIINSSYVCPNCGHTTRIRSWEELRATLQRIRNEWLDIQSEHPEYFSQEDLTNVTKLLNEVNSVIINKPQLN